MWNPYRVHRCTQTANPGRRCACPGLCCLTASRFGRPDRERDVCNNGAHGPDSDLIARPDNLQQPLARFQQSVDSTPRNCLVPGNFRSKAALGVLFAARDGERPTRRSGKGRQPSGPRGDPPGSFAASVRCGRRVLTARCSGSGGLVYCRRLDGRLRARAAGGRCCFRWQGWWRKPWVRGGGRRSVDLSADGGAWCRRCVMSWNQPRRVVVPWMETLARLLSGVALPTIRGRSLWVLSDYSFDNRKSDFEVVGLLVADPEASGDWKHLRGEVRAKLLADGRRMRWNKLNSDSRRQAAFLPFLRAADHICGLAIALAFHRHPAFQIPDDSLGRFQDSFHLSASWKPHHVQQMFRIAYCTAMVVAGLSNPGQDIHWVSDQDSALDNEPKERDTVSTFAKLLRMFVPHELGQLRYGTTACGAEPLLQEDLAAVPDLMCGAACEILTSIRREYTGIPEICSRLPKLAKRSQQFLDWYASGPWPLKRYICSFEGRKGRPASVGILDPSLLGRSPIVAGVRCPWPSVLFE